MLERLDRIARCQHRLEKRLLGDDHPVGCVLDHVLDLLLRRRVVDREAGGPEVHRRAVGQMQRRPVDQHEADRVAVPNPKLREPGGPLAHRLCVVPPARLVVRVLQPQRRTIRPLLRGDLKRLAHRRCRKCSRPLRHALTISPALRARRVLSRIWATTPAVAKASSGWSPNPRHPRERRVRLAEQRGAGVFGELDQRLGDHAEEDRRRRRRAGPARRDRSGGRHRGRSGRPRARLRQSPESLRRLRPVASTSPRRPAGSRRARSSCRPR